MNSRAITPVISVVLLLMMTVAIAGIAWFWLQGMTERILNATEETAEVQLGHQTFDIDFGSTKIYCTDLGNVDRLSVFVAVDGGTGVRLSGMLVDGNVVEGPDFLELKVGDFMGTGEYKEIVVKNYGELGKYTGTKFKQSDSVDLEIAVKTNRGKETATMTFDTKASNSVNCS